MRIDQMALLAGSGRRVIESFRESPSEPKADEIKITSNDSEDNRFLVDLLNWVRTRATGSCGRSGSDRSQNGHVNG